MTKEQSTAEMRYRLAKYVLQVLLDAELITTEEATAPLRQQVPPPSSAYPWC